MQLNWITTAILGLALIGCAGTPTAPTRAEREAFAPSGKLRAGLLANNPVHAKKDPATGELKGVALDIARELARRLDVPLEVQTLPTLPALVKSAETGRCDVVFVGMVPGRDKVVDFSPPFAQVEMGFLVAGGAPIAGVAEIDRPNVRIGVQRKGGADVQLTPMLRNATLVRTETIAESVDLLRTGKADAVAGIKTFLFPASDKVPGSRVLDDHVSVENVALAIPKNRGPAAAYLRRFVEDIKAEGFVRKAIDGARIRGLTPAP